MPIVCNQPGILSLTRMVSLPSSCLSGQGHLRATGGPVSSPGVFCHLPPSPPPPLTPLPTPIPTRPSLLPPTHPPPWAKVDAHAPLKNCLKKPKIKQGTTSKVNCILFNRSLSPALLNKSSLTQLISIKKIFK